MVADRPAARVKGGLVDSSMAELKSGDMNLTTAEMAAEFKYRYEERIAILREEVECKGEPTAEQDAIAKAEVAEWLVRLQEAQGKA